MNKSPLLSRLASPIFHRQRRGGVFLALLAWLTLAFLLSTAERAQAQTRGSNYGISAINVSQPPTPDYSLNGGANKGAQVQKWLEIEVQFSAPALPPMPPGQLPALGASDLTVRYFVLVGGNKLLTGEVTHTDVLGGQQLYSVMYVSPRSLQLLEGNKPFVTSDITNIEVQLTKPGVGQPLAIRQVKPGPPLGNSAFQQITGFLLNKSQTPFAPLYWDRYEVIKPASPR
ncbi:MAG: hypothetical protein JO295_14580 [Verrucomicrobia bacterium]|nr:hypothetical protein [Verrucomicrobiota bacterium]